jgi:hypothetical protein
MRQQAIRDSRAMSSAEHSPVHFVLTLRHSQSLGQVKSSNLWLRIQCSELSKFTPIEAFENSSCGQARRIPQICWSALPPHACLRCTDFAGVFLPPVCSPHANEHPPSDHPYHGLAGHDALPGFVWPDECPSALSDRLGVAAPLGALAIDAGARTATA